MTECCYTCRFYFPRHNNMGQCRRNPPEAAVLDEKATGAEGGVVTLWPVVLPGDWCGQGATASHLSFMGSARGRWPELR